eukprot:scaffold5634_cov19-Tisochrysis_lutea.AAC.1
METGKGSTASRRKSLTSISRRLRRSKQNSFGMGRKAAPWTCTSQFESKQISADDLEHYLKTAAEEAKAEEARALAKADQGRRMLGKMLQT